MDQGASGLGGEDDAVVEAVVALLPELDTGGLEEEAGPVWGAGDVCGEAVLGFLGGGHEGFAAGEGAALLRGPGTDLAHAGAALEVDVHVVRGEFGDGAFDADLALAGLPMQAESGVRVGAEFSAFAALAVGVEGEAFGGPAFEEDDADGGNSIRRGCGEGHGVWVVDLGGFGVVHPEFEEGEGICGFIHGRAGGRV